MNIRVARTAVAVTMLSIALAAEKGYAQETRPAKAHNVVLVHGAWADGSSGSGVIARLQAARLHVTAVQNPLASLADSVAATRRVLALQDGPTVLAAHSWGGTVISEVGRSEGHRSGLCRGSSTRRGQDFVALSGRFPTMPVRPGVDSTPASLPSLKPRFSTTSRTVSRATGRKSCLPFRNQPPPHCSASRRPRPHGAPSRAGTLCRSAIRRSRPTCNAFSPHG